MSDKPPTQRELLLAKVRETCIDGLKVGKNHFDLFIIPTAGLTDENLPAGFAEAVREFRDLSPSDTIVPHRLHYLPYYPVRRSAPVIGGVLKAFKGIQGWINRDEPKNFLVSVDVEGSQAQFACVLRSQSRRNDDGKLLPGEVEFIRFMDFAGHSLRLLKAIRNADGERAFVAFLVGYVWNHKRPKLSPQGVATVANLWTLALEALDTLDGPTPREVESDVPSKRRGRHKEDSPEELRIWALWETGQYRTALDLVKMLRNHQNPDERIKITEKRMRTILDKLRQRRKRERDRQGS